MAAIAVIAIVLLVLLWPRGGGDEPPWDGDVDSSGRRTHPGAAGNRSPARPAPKRKE